MATQPALNKAVFINCPFDEAYQPLLLAIVFAIHACGYESRCALQDASSELRLDRLKNLIEMSDRTIHDLSRIELSEASDTPRFNMPFELGVAIGAKLYGGPRQRRKINLVLVRRRNEWLPSISDLAGIDPVFHDDSPRKALTAVRNFLAQTPDGGRLPGAASLWATYQRFAADLPTLAQLADHTLDEAKSYVAYVEFVTEFLQSTR